MRIYAEQSSPSLVVPIVEFEACSDPRGAGHLFAARDMDGVLSSVTRVRFCHFHRLKVSALGSRGFEKNARKPIN